MNSLGNVVFKCSNVLTGKKDGRKWLKLVVVSDGKFFDVLFNEDHVKDLYGLCCYYLGKEVEKND